MKSVRKCRKQKQEDSPMEENPYLPSQSMDLISQLPVHLLHALLEYYLPRKDATRTCVLSKTWRAINYGHPVLFFDERNFLPLQKPCYSTVTWDNIVSGDYNYGVGNGIRIMHLRRQYQLTLEEAAMRKECHDSFMNYIDKRIASLLQQEFSPIEQFHLIIINFYHERDPPCLDLWLKHAFERSMMRNLVLNIFTTLFEDTQTEVVYTLPSSCFVSQTLTQLMLANCNLADAAGNLKLPQLTHIFLSNLEVEDDFIKCLIFGCPLLQVVDLSYCQRLAILSLNSLPHLERLAIRSCPDLEILDIQLPQLQYFEYHAYEGKMSHINLPTSNVIKQMVVAYILFLDCDSLQEYIVNCEELTLIGVAGLEDIRLSSQKLHYLTFRHCITKGIEIDCPNLCSLMQFTNLSPPHRVNSFKLREIIFEFSCDDYRHHTPLSHKLKEYFGSCSPIQNLIKQLIIHSEDQKEVFVLHGSFKSMAHVFSKVKVLMSEAKLTISSLDVKDLVNYFCDNSTTSSQTLTVISTRKDKSNFSQALYLELSRSKENASHCKDGIYHIWRRDLSNVTVDDFNVPTELRSYQFKSYKISRLSLEWRVMKI